MTQLNLKEGLQRKIAIHYKVTNTKQHYKTSATAKSEYINAHAQKESKEEGNEAIEGFTEVDVSKSWYRLLVRFHHRNGT
jgi:hypothetical protein